MRECAADPLPALLFFKQIGALGGSNVGPNVLGQLVLKIKHVWASPSALGQPFDPAVELFQKMSSCATGNGAGNSRLLIHPTTNVVPAAAKAVQRNEMGRGRKYLENATRTPAT